MTQTGYGCNHAVCIAAQKVSKNHGIMVQRTVHEYYPKIYEYFLSELKKESMNSAGNE